MEVVLVEDLLMVVRSGQSAYLVLPGFSCEFSLRISGLRPEPRPTPSTLASDDRAFFSGFPKLGIGSGGATG